MRRLENQVAIVSGAASGIGRGIAIKFAQEGANEVSDEIIANGGSALAIKVDVGNKHQVLKGVEKVIEKLGKINILVNNAIKSSAAKLIDKNVDYWWQKVIGTNLTGAFYMTQAVVKMMVAHKWKGSIINITSVHSQVPAKKRAFYTAAKTGLVGATKSWALELAPCGIRVNAIAPGSIMNTGMNPNINEKTDKKEAKKIDIPLGRNGTPDDIAKVAVFLVSNEASYITGQELFVDGGFTLVH